MSVGVMFEYRCLFVCGDVACVGPCVGGVNVCLWWVCECMCVSVSEEVRVSGRRCLDTGAYNLSQGTSRLSLMVCCLFCCWLLMFPPSVCECVVLI